MVSMARTAETVVGPAAAEHVTKLLDRVLAEVAGCPHFARVSKS